MPRRLSEEAVADLDIDALVDALSASPQGRRLAERLLTHLPVDPEVSRYRQESYRYLRERPAVRRSLAAVIPRLRELTIFSRSQEGAESPFLGAVWRIGELDLYVECLDGLHAAFEEAPPGEEHRAMQGLRDLVAERRNGAAVEALRREIPPIKAGLRRRRSVTIGVNLDDRLRPVEAKLVSVHDRPFSETGLLTGFLRSIRGSGDERPVSTPLHRTPTAGDAAGYSTKMPLSPLFQDLESIMRSTSRRLLSKIDRFLGVETRVLQSLPDELELFIAATELAERLEAAGLPTAVPTLEEIGARSLQAGEVYNLALALRRLKAGTGGNGADHDGTKGSAEPGEEPVVPNDIAISGGTLGAVITGPNRGGKTTYLQAVGQSQVMAQAGLFVPAREARVSPVDYLATHFPHREQSASELGRFGEEVARLSGIFDRISPESLILLNESFASTNPTEAMTFGEEVLKALGEAGARVLVATHLLDMARRAPGLGPFTALTAEVEAGAEGARRTFRIVPGMPKDSSYAYDLVRRAGMTYEQLSERLRQRGVLSGNGVGDGVQEQ